MTRTLRWLVAVGLLLQVACGGGGGNAGDSTGGSSGGTSTSTAKFSLATHSLVFSAAGPTSPTPDLQQITAQITGSFSGSPNIHVETAGAAIYGTLGLSIQGSTSTLQVRATPPAALGSGTYTGTVTVHACIDNPPCGSGEMPGSPQTVNVTYTIGQPTIADAVMPHVISAAAPGQVVIRGHGFSNVSNVSFGAMPATSFTIVTDSEIHASYPALTAGAYPVSLSGGPTFSGTVVAVAPIAFASQLIPFPEQNGGLRKLVYDAERQALYVGVDFPTSTNNKLWRFRYVQGAWTAPDIITVPNLRDLTLNQDGTRLLVLTSDSVLEFDSSNPTTGPLETNAAPAEMLSQSIPLTDESFLSDTKFSVALTSIALANDGTAIVTVSYSDLLQEHGAYLYFYSTTTGTFTPIQPFESFGTSTATTSTSGGSTNQDSLPLAAASADGSRVFIVASSSKQPILQFNASTSTPSRLSTSALQYWGRPPAIDSAADRIIIYPNPGFLAPTNVYDANFGVLGQLTLDSIPASLVMNPKGTRAYGLFDTPYPNNVTLETFDLTAAATGGNYPPSGSNTLIASPSADFNFNVLGTITPDGGTLFFASDNEILVVPAPQ